MREGYSTYHNATIIWTVRIKWCDRENNHIAWEIYKCSVAAKGVQHTTTSCELSFDLGVMSPVHAMTTIWKHLFVYSRRQQVRYRGPVFLPRVYFMRLPAQATAHDGPASVSKALRKHPRARYPFASPRQEQQNPCNRRTASDRS